MSKALGMRCVWGLCGVLVSVLALASVTRAETTTDVSGSVLVFPKVIWTGFTINSMTEYARDTVVQISNTSNNTVHAHCFYVDARTVNGSPLWQITDFDIWLTRQQPTHWVVSQGRSVNPGDAFGNDGSGLDPGAVPPVPDGFEGELKCVQVDASGVPFGGNNLKGETLIRDISGDVSKSNAIAILANPDLASADPANELLLDNSVLHDGEYNSCPNQLLVDHFVDGTPNPVVEAINPLWCTNDDCPIRTELTLVPCSQDFENSIPSSVTVQFSIVNELEQVFSASTTVDCWKNFRLTDVDAPTGKCTVDGSLCTSDEDCIDANNGFCNKNSVFAVGVLGTGSAFTRVSPVALDGGVLGVAEEIHYNNLTVTDVQRTTRATASWNLQQLGNRYDATLETNPDTPVVDKIVIPSNF